MTAPRSPTPPQYSTGTLKQDPDSLAVAVINDWVIIENDAIASICPAEEFDARYQTTP